MIKPPYDLRCESLFNPICIDIQKPRFSWLLTHGERNQNQMGYQIIVSSDKNLSKSEKGDVWESGSFVLYKIIMKILKEIKKKEI